MSISKITILLFTLLSFFCTSLSAQSVSGHIQNQKGEIIPFVNIYIKQTTSGTSANLEGYYFLTLIPGEYEMVFSAIGYQAKTSTIVIGDDDIVRNIQMEPSSVELDEIVVKASKRDPAYAIIQHAIDNKKKYLSQVASYKTEVYIKATEKIDKKEKKKKEKTVELEKEKNIDGSPIDPFEEAEKAKQILAGKLNIVEMQLTLNYQFPNNYKEERTAYKKYGSKEGLFIPRFAESDFNFYRNRVDLKELAEVPLISPISRTSILFYKYKLISSTEENGILVHKIKVIPRKSGSATCRGYIYINEGLWNINRVDVHLDKGGLKIYDAFQLKQNYSQIDDSLWIPYRQEFIYETKLGRSKTFSGNTILHYSDYQKDFKFPKRFFGNEIATTSQEAYERDTTYWKEARPEALTFEEEKVVRYRDSIEAIVNSDAYQDSVQQEYNKVQLLDVLWDGVGFRSNARKEHFYIGSLAALIDWEIIGGLRLGPYVSYFRRYENGKMFNTNLSVNMGLRNQDLQGYGYTWLRYDPFRLADISIFGGRSFESINSYDAYLNLLRSSNYILHDHIGLEHRIELFNGFYFNTDFTFSDRQSIVGYDSQTWIDRAFGDNSALTFVDEEPIAFDDYKAFISELSISYTPRQKYMTEPKRKVILGSSWPTFNITHKKGWNNFLESDVNFDYLEFNIVQDIILGVFGNSKYTAKVGQFFNTKNVKFIDLKRFRQSDQYLYSNPLYSFQSLDTALATTDVFFEFHYIHHFNGALINNIPLVKKLKIRTVVGGGLLWVQEQKIRHEEVFAGIERTFKIGPRRRLRLGVYGVFANSNFAKSNTALKFSIDIIDTWKKDWSF